MAAVRLPGLVEWKALLASNKANVHPLPMSWHRQVLIAWTITASVLDRWGMEPWLHEGGVSKLDLGSRAPRIQH